MYQCTSLFINVLSSMLIKIKINALEDVKILSQSDNVKNYKSPSVDLFISQYLFYKIHHLETFHILCIIIQVIMFKMNTKAEKLIAYTYCRWCHLQ